jgi:hypothetical protein
MHRRTWGLLGLLTLFTSLAWASPVLAAPRVDLSVIDASDGIRLPVYPHRGEHFIAGAPGHRYTLRLTNRSGGRVLAVVSVDGVNVISGETAHVNQTGYVLAPYGSVDIEGWRKSQHDVAEFIFTALSDSYAAQTGRPGNVGVIGVAVFDEYMQPPPPVVRYPEIASDRRAAEGKGRDAAPASAPAPSAQSADKNIAREQSGAVMEDRQESLGTGHGDRRWSPSTRTHFEPASRTPAELIVVRYDSVENLRDRGVRIPYPRRPQHYPEPQPFPGYTPDPPRRDW